MTMPAYLVAQLPYIELKNLHTHWLQWQGSQLFKPGGESRNINLNVFMATKDF
jgi:hypothetical protein